jgi:rhodanese-related sulfurtransferase
MTSLTFASEDESFPKRPYYPQLSYIDTQSFSEGLKNQQFQVIDVRDATSYQALHVKDAKNIFIKSDSFDNDILTLLKSSKLPIVVYCNGISCSKSYDASVKILDLVKKNKLSHIVYTYDSGINALAYEHNELVLKNGKPVSSDNPLIAINEIQKHTLAPADFEKYLHETESDQFALLDIRENNEKIIFNLFMFQKDKKIPLTNRDKLIRFLNKVKQDKKTLMVYDLAGRQINGLYELLNITGIKKWHYLEGGEYGYSQYAMKSAGL